MLLWPFLGLICHVWFTQLLHGDYIVQITRDLVHAAAHMEGICGHAPATKILKLEVTSYLWCLASRRTLIHRTIPWNRSSDHRFTARRKCASQQSATHQVLTSLNYWYNGYWVNRNGSKYSKSSVAFCELKKLCLYYRMDSFSGWPSLLSWVRDG